MPLNELPADDGTLYLIRDCGTVTGIGTADEIRSLVADGVVPQTVTMDADVAAYLA